MPEEAPQIGFFISYNKADRSWAEWIAWKLDDAGYSTILQAWDFQPGSNFILEMQRAATEAERTIAVLSPDFLTAPFTQPEWAAAFAQDPTGKNRTLIPVRVRECKTEGLLPQIIYIDLVGLPESEAADRLLSGVSEERAKPATEYKPKPRRPSASISSTTLGNPRQPAWRSAGRMWSKLRWMSVTTTSAPSWARRKAMARPIPWRPPAPVTMATLPLRSYMAHYPVLKIWAAAVGPVAPLWGREWASGVILPPLADERRERASWS